MGRNGAVHPRWVLRRDERRAGRYGGDKVIRWIAAPPLMKGHRKKAPSDTEEGGTAAPERSRPVSLRLVSDT